MPPPTAVPIGRGTAIIGMALRHQKRMRDEMPGGGGGWLIESRLDETDERNRGGHRTFISPKNGTTTRRRMMMMMMEDDLHLPWQSELLVGTGGDAGKNK
ncbi:hypothetical protein niasHT_011307 [Heterodera trifolii]|uniref:Uncharacterized protein n=1 Tax=Heterodera trifolii TaxID=157864 RepID=A0ABD2LC86_9BILA